MGKRSRHQKNAQSEEELREARPGIEEGENGQAENSDDFNETFSELLEEEAAGEETLKENKKRKVRSRAFYTAFAVCGALIVAIAAFAGGWFIHYLTLDEKERELLWALDTLQDNYYRPVDEDELYDSVYNGLKLDSYTRFFPPVDYSDYQADNAGHNVGVGVSISDERKDGVTIPRFFIVYENSPACNAGLRKGMYLLGFGKSESELQSGVGADFNKFMSETEGEFVVRCGYLRDGSDAKLFTLTQKSYQAGFVHYRDSESSFRFLGEKKLALTETNEPIASLDEKTAYIRLDEFNGNAAKEFEECLEKMKERGRSNLILDLRTNGGGAMTVLCKIAAHLLRNASGRSPVVARAVYRDGSAEEFSASGNDFSKYFNADSKFRILADENTASASECLIGAMIDYGTLGFGDIILRQNEKGVAKTYGKGIMQTTYTYPLTGAAMKMTTAEIFWPNGKSIHGVGVLPSDGAVAVEADLIWGEPDPMLQAAIF